MTMQNPEKPNSRDELLVTVAQTKLGPLELEVAENPSDRLLAVFLLDCSTSMAGPPIDELNQCVARLIDELREDPFTSITVDMAIVAFSSTAQLVLPPTAIRHLEPGQFTPLAAGGNTALGAAVDLAGKVIPDRLKYYSRVGLGAYRPCVFVLSDGQPNDQWEAPAARFRAQAEKHKWPVFCVGLGDCDLQVLAQVAPANLPPQKLRDDTKLKELFSWVKDSLASYSKSQGGAVTMPPVHPWANP